MNKEQLFYPMLLNELLKYLTEKKEQDKDISLLDLIMEYSMRKSLDLDLIGDAISTDIYLKNLIEKDLEYHNFITNKNKDLEW
jgi:hypothetical protein